MRSALCELLHTSYSRDNFCRPSFPIGSAFGPGRIVLPSALASAGVWPRGWHELVELGLLPAGAARPRSAELALAGQDSHDVIDRGADLLGAGLLPHRRILMNDRQRMAAAPRSSQKGRQALAAFRYGRVGQGHCRLFSPNVEPNADGGAGCGRGSKQHIGIASKKYKPSPD